MCVDIIIRHFILMLHDQKSNSFNMIMFKSHQLFRKCVSLLKLTLSLMKCEKV